MEYLKEVYEAWGARIKSNIFGSIIVAFCLVNWRALFFPVFEDAKAVEKFAFFDAQTTVLTLYVWPMFLGLFVALVLPYANNCAHWYVSKPVSAMRSRDDERAHERLLKKNAWLLERNREQELLEQGIIEAAKRDEEVSEIADPELKASTEEKIMRARFSMNENTNRYLFDGRHGEKIDYSRIKLSEPAKSFLIEIAKRPQGKFSLESTLNGYRLYLDGVGNNIKTREKFLELKEAAEELRALELIDPKENAVSWIGYKYLEHLGYKPL